MAITKTFSIDSNTGKDDVFIETSGVINQPNAADQLTATGSFKYEGQRDKVETSYLLSVTTDHSRLRVGAPCQSNNSEPHITTVSNTKETQPENSPSYQLLFRVTHNQSMGTSMSGRATLPGDRNRYPRPLHDSQFNWRTWLKSHGNFDKNLSIGTSFTSNFLHAISIALRYHFEKKSGITIIVVQKQFLIPGTCLRFDDLIAWSELPRRTFGPKKKNEYSVIGPVPPAAVVSRFTFKSLEKLDYLCLFPKLHSGSMPTLRLEELRTAMQLGSATFDVAKHQTKFFLSCLLGNQEGVCPHDASTRQLVILFIALAKGSVHTEDFGRKLDQETLDHIDVLVRDIKMLQEMNKERNIDTNERYNYKEEDIEGTIKRWALKNPICKEFVTPSKGPAIQDFSRSAPIPLARIPSHSSQDMPAPPNSASSDPFRSRRTAIKPFSLHPIPSTSRPFTQNPALATSRPSTPSLAPAPTSASDSFTPTSSFPSPPPTRPSSRRQYSSNLHQSPPSTPSKKRKVIDLREKAPPRL
jgi:hypothetical protein